MISCIDFEDAHLYPDVTPAFVFCFFLFCFVCFVLFVFFIICQIPASAPGAAWTVSSCNIMLSCWRLWFKVTANSEISNSESFALVKVIIQVYKARMRDEKNQGHNNNRD